MDKKLEDLIKSRDKLTDEKDVCQSYLAGSMRPCKRTAMKTKVTQLDAVIAKYNKMIDELN